MEHGVDTVLCVTTGDCSNTVMLMEVLKLKGLKVIPFAYPDKPDAMLMQRSLEELASSLNTTLDAAEKVREQLKPCRDLALKLDELTWKEGVVSGYENHLWLVSASDFNQDDKRYRQELGELIEQCRKRQPHPSDHLRIAYIGVPSVYGRDLYNYMETQGARVVFNEIQRQFAMPQPGKSLAEQYTAYTYPYSIYDRLKDITTELKKRQVDGVIHYVQAFCFRQIEDIIVRKALDVPVLTIEGNRPGRIDLRTQIRIEAFLDMLRSLRD